MALPAPPALPYRMPLLPERHAAWPMQAAPPSAHCSASASLRILPPFQNLQLPALQGKLTAREVCQTGPTQAVLSPIMNSARHQLWQALLPALQEELAALEDRMQVLRRRNSTLERMLGEEQAARTTTQHEVGLCMAMGHWTLRCDGTARDKEGTKAAQLAGACSSWPRERSVPPKSDRAALCI